MTETVKHTRGPWEACDRGDYFDDGIVILGDDLRVAVVNRDEDAPLIAAAPEILEALIMALPYIETAEFDEGYKPGVVAKVAKAMRAAIDSAEGRT